MEVTNTTVQLNVITASDGYLLYRKSDSLESAYFTPRIYLGTGDSADNYQEITQAEVDAEMQRREQCKQQAKANLASRKEVDVP